MSFELNLIIGSAAAVIAAAALIAAWAQKKRCKESQEAAEVSIHHVKTECESRAENLKAELKSELREALSSFEAGLCAPERTITEGRINRTVRSEAMRLLRSGLSPETAATTLDLPKKDVLLLAKVAAALAAQ